MRATAKVSLIVSLLALAVCLNPHVTRADDNLMTAIRKATEVKVALGSAPPHVVVSQSGQAVGYMVEIVNLVLKGMGLRAFTPVQAGVAAIIGGRADGFAVGQFTIPDSEQKSVQLVLDDEAPLHGFGAVFGREDVHFS
ncbi:hypothetical protein XI06_12805 [Bradyrhizobium sp. CCBAU 11434]|uniref:hypothetical protein n=1 Tax=Bradyrhizobium sp. CCBAU 11434 TaxID=1630885 RepID=UPI00230597EC|nr:hypothetical protein [Bradyrhizobium sp. CCBAU 11434]MDA9521233.1 hypothetical protein [Bradyrhizobium sp. CCBAU 11434]